jgi:heme a synthase
MAQSPYMRAMHAARPRAIAHWLFFVAFLVFCMVVVGGITRLTESGLSITEWKPVSGAIPPLTAADWQAAFDAYKRVPQYEAMNAGMTMAQFQFIFFWEWVHRLLGRVIGLAFALPLAWFWVRRAIPAGYTPRLVALLALGGAQGAIGWWMVTSGLWQGVSVSHYRLAVHLLLALFILAALVWTALDLRALARDRSARPARLTGFAMVAAAVLFVQLLFGAWVAGMRAGKVTQNWPMMSDSFLPTGIDWSQGWAVALSSDPYLVHFIHRWWAFVALAAIVMLATRVKRAGVRPAAIALHSALGVQVVLGIATVMTGVNISLAVAHQGVGALLVASVAWGAHALGQRGQVPSVAGIRPIFGAIKPVSA